MELAKTVMVDLDLELENENDNEYQMEPQPSSQIKSEFGTDNDMNGPFDPVSESIGN